MRARHRRREVNEQPDADQPGSGSDGSDLQSLRRAAEQLLAAGDEALDRALSTDSRAFLAASRQQGGQ